MEDKQLDMVGSEAPRSRVTTERIKCSARYKGVGVVKGQLRLGSKTGSFPVFFFLFLRGPFAPSTKTRFVQSCGGNVGSTSHLCGLSTMIAASNSPAFRGGGALIHGLDGFASSITALPELPRRRTNDGHNRYYGVPMNDAALDLFRLQVGR